MHALHARLPKHFVLEERLERYADAIEAAPASYAGVWAEACRPLDAEGAARFSEVRLDMGCGKGAFTVEAAAREKDVLFVGIDFEPICIAYAAQKAVESGLDNVVFCPGISDKLGDYFAAGEVSRIYLNFPTPFPRKKEARQRLTYLDNLLRYRQILAPGGTVLLKTDSYPLWRFAQTQFALAGYQTLWLSEDARAERPDDVTTEYEQRLAAQGATVYAIEARPGGTPATFDQPISLSLVDYLPQDLESMDYVPHGMQGSVTNLRNRRIHEQKRRHRS